MRFGQLRVCSSAPFYYADIKLLKISIKHNFKLFLIRKSSPKLKNFHPKKAIISGIGDWLIIYYLLFLKLIFEDIFKNLCKLQWHHARVILHFITFARLIRERWRYWSFYTDYYASWYIRKVIFTILLKNIVKTVLSWKEF